MILFVQSGRAPYHPRHHHRLAASLSNAGYEVITLSQPARGKGGKGAVPVEHLPVRKGRLGRMLSGPLTMLRAWRRRPQLIYIVCLDLLPWAAVLRRLTGIRVMYDSSEQYDDYMLTKEYLPGRLRGPVRAFVGRAEPWLAARLDAATTAVPATQSKFERAGVRSVLVRNFPPRALTELARLRAEPEYDVLVGGSLHADGVRVLADSARELGERGAGDVRWLAVCRNYSERDKAFLESALADAGVRHQFELRYDLPFAEVQELTTRARIGFIGYPDRPYYRIALPIRVLEYMAVGLPFVTARLPLVRELLGDDEVGLLEKPGDARAYAAALASLLDDPERQARMSAQGPGLIRGRYNWEFEAEKLFGLVSDVLR